MSKGAGYSHRRVVAQLCTKAMLVKLDQITEGPCSPLGVQCRSVLDCVRCALAGTLHLLHWHGLHLAREFQYMMEKTWQFCCIL